MPQYARQQRSGAEAIVGALPHVDDEGAVGAARARSPADARHARDLGSGRIGEHTRARGSFRPACAAGRSGAHRRASSASRSRRRSGGGYGVCQAFQMCAIGRSAPPTFVVIARGPLPCARARSRQACARARRSRLDTDLGPCSVRYSSPTRVVGFSARGPRLIQPNHLRRQDFGEASPSLS
jgi:hypothetical protein